MFGHFPETRFLFACFKGGIGKKICRQIQEETVKQLKY